MLFGLNRQSCTASLQADRLKVEGAFRNPEFSLDSFIENAVNKNYSFNLNCILIVFCLAKLLA